MNDEFEMTWKKTVLAC